MAKKKINIKEPKIAEQEKAIEEIKAPEIPVNPITLQEHLQAGFVNLQQSENLQKSGKVVKEIKQIEGETLHRLE